MKKIDLFNSKLKQKKMELRESSNIPVTPHEERGGDDWLYLPPSSKTNKKKRHTTQEDRETNIRKNNQTLGGRTNHLGKTTQLAF